MLEAMYLLWSQTCALHLGSLWTVVVGSVVFRGLEFCGRTRLHLNIITWGRVKKLVVAVFQMYGCLSVDAKHNACYSPCIKKLQASRSILVFWML